MSTARLIIGDALDALATLPDSSVDLVLTSPPFLALRSYLPDDHPDKHCEIGSEPDPAVFIDRLLNVVAALDRVLAPHGSIVVELGDTYAGSGGSGGDYRPGGFRDGQPRPPGSAAAARSQPQRATWRLNPDGTAKTTDRSHEPHNQTRVLPANGGPGWPLAKSLVLVPELFRVALAYGINPLTGEPSPAGQWRIRNIVRWYRPNPAPGAQADKFWPATSDLAIACRRGDRYWDPEAARVPGADTTTSGNGDAPTRPMHDTWTINAVAYRGAHYAAFPPELCSAPINAMCPRRVCRTCGQPRRRITEPTPEYAAFCGQDMYAGAEAPRSATERAQRGRATTINRIAASRVTVGWSDCGCGDTGDKWRRGTVLDPFAGSGTTLAVATGLGRDAIGIDIDARNEHLVRERVGMLLTDVTHLIAEPVTA